MVWDPEGLQPPETDGHPGEADAEDNQVLAATEGHSEAHGSRRLAAQSRPDGKYCYRQRFSYEGGKPIYFALLHRPSACANNY